MKPLNFNTEVQIRYAERLIAEQVSRRLGDSKSSLQLPTWLDSIPPSIKDYVLHEVTKIAHTIATKGGDEAAVCIYDYLESAKSKAVEAIELWKYLMKTGQHTGAKSVYKAVQKLIANVDCDTYSAIYAASIELDRSGNLLDQYNIMRNGLDKELQKVRDTNRASYPKPKAQYDSEKQQYLAEMEKFVVKLEDWQARAIADLAPSFAEELE